MRVVVQRVHEAHVTVENRVVGEIKKGLVLLIGIADTDELSDIEYVSDKIVMLRVFADEENKMNRSVKDIQGEILAISQFTLLADVSRGRRPSFIAAADPLKGKRLYELCIQRLRSHNIHVKSGRFGAMMNVHLINDGPVTLVVDSKPKLKQILMD